LKPFTGWATGFTHKITANNLNRFRRAISVRWLLLSVNGLILLVPVVAVLGLRLYQTQFIRQTEIKLIAESILIGEAWREHLLREMGIAQKAAPNMRPPDLMEERYTPIRPILDGTHKLLRPLKNPTLYTEDRNSPEFRAGAEIKPILDRAKIFNLSGVKVLNKEGYVVATTGGWLGAYLGDLPETKEALQGRYSAVARRRIMDPKPALSSISRRGDARVFTATPIFSDGEVIGAVWMSRTSMDPLKAAWLDRKPLLIAFLASAGLTGLVSFLLSLHITKPLRKITETAYAISHGDSSKSLELKGFVPAEIHTLAGSLATMTKQMSDRAAYIAEYAANVTHELKSPITSIQGAAELLREEGKEMPDDQREKFLENIRFGAERMERLVNRLLELARIQSAPESSEKIEVKPFLLHLASYYEDRVKLDVDEAPSTVEINKDHLHSAIRNLLDNAARHGQGKPIELTAKAKGDRLAVTVRDHGPGITPANQEKIFKRFFTTERDSGGTGLGLAIVQAVAETRGGEVRFETGDEGTAFTLVV